MAEQITITPGELQDHLLAVGFKHPVFIFGPPGVGKTSIVEKFAADVGLECVPMPGTGLQPEDVVGVPSIDVAAGVARWWPPSFIKRDKPFLLFLDELNACSVEVQKSFYSLLREQRAGEYRLPKGSVIIAAGNRSQDQAITKPLPTPIVGRVSIVYLNVSLKDWLSWAEPSGVHPWVLEYLKNRPTHLMGKPTQNEPFSSPRSWEILSDALHGYGDGITQRQIEISSFGSLTPEHAVQFNTFIKVLKNKYAVASVIKGDMGWPKRIEERDLLYFLAMSLRDQLLKGLPQENSVAAGTEAKKLAHRAKELIMDLATVNFEIAQMVVAKGGDGETLPPWFMAEIVRDLPRLISQKDK
jgi:hypothetical protein